MSIKALLTRIIDYLTTKSTSVSNSSMKKDVMYLWKQGNVVTFESIGDFVNLPAGSSSRYVTIPEGYRPRTTTQYYRCVNNGTLIVMYVAIDGGVSFFNYGSAITSATNGAFQGVWMA